MQPVEKNNLSTAEDKEPTSADNSNIAALSNDVTSPRRLAIPNRDGAVSPTGPVHQPPVSPLRQKSKSPGIIYRKILCPKYLPYVYLISSNF